MHSLLSVFRRVAKSQREGVREHPVIFIACVWQIETVNDQLKNISHLEHPRHRRVTGFIVNVVAGLIAYSHRPKKPSLGLRRNPLVPMLVM